MICLLVKHLASLQVKHQQVRKEKRKKKFRYKCKLASCRKFLRSMEGVNSNLSTHLGTKNHEAVKKDYEALINKGKPRQSILIDTFNSESSKQANSKTNSQSTNNLINMGAVKKVEKYQLGSSLQADRYIRLLIMIIKCMLPII